MWFEILIYPLYIVPPEHIIYIYDLQQNLCILIIVFLILASILELKFLTKIVLSILSSIIAILHYYVLILVSKYESIALIPLFIVESTKKGSVLSLDYGQIMFIVLIVLWRKELIRYFKRLHKGIVKREATSVSSDEAK
ncbi:MAG: hypothetical protein B6U89_04120 [Desulfurococcales archaeon ex4484_58]|nr:MAG: hypothetical protein B6U89_04120 [Desulfurococcales archaeon ex4484_58]